MQRNRIQINPPTTTEEFIVHRQGFIASQRSLPRQGRLAFVRAAVFAMSEPCGSTQGGRPLGNEDDNHPGKGGA